MLIIKILGSGLMLMGMIYTFSLYFEGDYTKFGLKLAFGPLLIAAGLFLMKIEF
ncbi:MAG: hypothetical protein QXM68_03630 [Candidatus Aenigmatarchaeota archaeon]|nr:hypothetical protein [Candidatus Aenigmarchaeota archaeon]